MAHTHYGWGWSLSLSDPPLLVRTCTFSDENVITVILGIVYIQRKRKTGGKAFLSLDRGQGGGHNQLGAAWRFPGLSGGGHRWLPPNPLHLWHRAVGRHHTKPVVSGPRNARDEKHLVTGTDRMQPGANCDSTRSLPGFRGPLW